MVVVCACFYHLKASALPSRALDSSCPCEQSVRKNYNWTLDLTHWELSCGHEIGHMSRHNEDLLIRFTGIGRVDQCKGTEKRRSTGMHKTSATSPVRDESISAQSTEQCNERRDAQDIRDKFENMSRHIEDSLIRFVVRGRRSGSWTVAV